VASYRRRWALGTCLCTASKCPADARFFTINGGGAPLEVEIDANDVDGLAIQRSGRQMARHSSK
jgi:hypothetical protein